LVNLPDVACFATGLTDVGNRESQVKRQWRRQQIGPGEVVLGDFGEDII
jgi:hypothetical protein